MASGGRTKKGRSGWEGREIVKGGAGSLGLVPRGQFDPQKGGMEKGLASGISTAEGVDVEHFGEHIEFTTHQTIRPMHVDWQGSLEEFDAATIIGAADKDDQGLGASAWTWGNQRGTLGG